MKVLLKRTDILTLSRVIIKINTEGNSQFRNVRRAYVVGQDILSLPRANEVGRR